MDTTSSALCKHAFKGSGFGNKILSERGSPQFRLWESKSIKNVIPRHSPFPVFALWSSLLLTNAKIPMELRSVPDWVVFYVPNRKVFFSVRANPGQNDLSALSRESAANCFSNQKGP